MPLERRSWHTGSRRSRRLPELGLWGSWGGSRHTVWETSWSGGGLSLHIPEQGSRIDPGIPTQRFTVTRLHDCLEAHTNTHVPLRVVSEQTDTHSSHTSGVNFTPVEYRLTGLIDHGRLTILLCRCTQDPQVLDAGVTFVDEPTL